MISLDMEKLLVDMANSSDSGSNSMVPSQRFQAVGCKLDFRLPLQYFHVAATTAPFAYWALLVAGTIGPTPLGHPWGRNPL